MTICDIDEPQTIQNPDSVSNPGELLPVLSTRQAAQLLEIQPHYLRTLVSRNKLPAGKDRQGRLIFEREVIVRYRETHRRAAPVQFKRRKNSLENRIDSDPADFDRGEMTSVPVSDIMGLIHGQADERKRLEETLLATIRLLEGERADNEYLRAHYQEGLKALARANEKVPFWRRLGNKNRTENGRKGGHGDER
jgi:predicted site-specific integrase-resolvase